MAHVLNRLNGPDYQLALGALGATANETVLELGFGGGVGVGALLDAGVHVIASEPSEPMRERAYRRFSKALASGALEVWPYPAEELPGPEDLPGVEPRVVHRALSMNTVYFWEDIDAGFAKLRRLVKTRVVFGIAQPSHLTRVGFAEEGFRVEDIEWYAEHLAAAGFAISIVPARKGTTGLLIGDA